MLGRELSRAAPAPAESAPSSRVPVPEGLGRPGVPQAGGSLAELGVATVGSAGLQTVTLNPRRLGTQRVAPTPYFACARLPVPGDRLLLVTFA